MASAIDVTKPVPYEPQTESVRGNFTVASAEISELQQHLLDPPPGPRETSLVIAWRDEAGTLHALGRVMVDIPDATNDGNRWLFLRVD